MTIEPGVVDADSGSETIVGEYGAPRVSARSLAGLLQRRWASYRTDVGDGIPERVEAVHRWPPVAVAQVFNDEDASVVGERDKRR